MRCICAVKETANRLDPEERNRLVVFQAVNMVVIQEAIKTDAHTLQCLQDRQTRKMQVDECYRQMRAVIEFRWRCGAGFKAANNCFNFIHALVIILRVGHEGDLLSSRKIKSEADFGITSVRL